MNIDHELRIVRSLITQAEQIEARIQQAKKNTEAILAACDSVGVTVVGIGAKSDDLKDSRGHPFGADGSIFADGRSKEKWIQKGGKVEERDGYPVAWEIARKSGLSGGCGNTGQHQIVGEVLNGVYRCVNGVWSKDD